MTYTFNNVTSSRTITANGVKASTTHNVYRIYVMSGYLPEYVSTHVNTGKSSLSSYASNLVSPYTTYGTKYVDIYPIGTTDNQESPRFKTLFFNFKFLVCTLLNINGKFYRKSSKVYD